MKASACLLTYGISVGEDEFQAEDVAVVDGVAVEDADIEEPFLEVVAFHELDARRQAKLVYLWALSALQGRLVLMRDASSKRRRRRRESGRGKGLPTFWRSLATLLFRMPVAMLCFVVC